MADPPPYHCKDCGLVFDSSKSLDVHLQYHKENLLSKWALPNDESNNNHVQHHQKKNSGSGGGGRPVATVPADSSEPSQPQQQHIIISPADRYFQQQTYLSPPTPKQEDQGFVLGTGSGFPHMARTPTPNSCSSPSPLHQANSYRFHPYQQQQHYTVAPSPDHLRNGLVSSSSPQQCDKCGFVCESASLLVEHISMSHPPTPGADHLFRHQGGLIGQIKSESGGSQAEILDLDSHKVHVYQPPRPQELPPQEHSVSALMSWVNEDKEPQRFHPHNGGNGMASPDCYTGVSTTTLSLPDPAEHHQMVHQQPQPQLHQNTYHHQHQQFDHISSLGTNSQHQISSTQMTMSVGQQQGGHMTGGGGGGGGGKAAKASQGGSGGASWKSNEPRRPKTYNCSACNKWFTSSGHLKRHYNTTLHKNAVKTSGVPDPANMPISAHHHPQKDTTYNPPESPLADASPEEQQQPQPPPPAPPPAPPTTQHQQQQQQQHIQHQPQPQQPPAPPPPLHHPHHHHLNHLNQLNHFLPSPPNLMAGPSEVTGGLLLHTTPYPEILPHQQSPPTKPSTPPASFLFTPPPHHMPTYPTPQHPNFQPPHVSTTGQLVTTTSNISGNLNLMDIQQYLLEAGKQESLLQERQQQNNIPLPSFSQQFQLNSIPDFSSFHPVISSSESDVGGPQNSSTFEPLYHQTQSPLQDSTNYYGSLQTETDAGNQQQHFGSHESDRSTPPQCPTSTDGHSTDGVDLKIVSVVSLSNGDRSPTVSSTMEMSPPPQPEANVQVHARQRSPPAPAAIKATDVTEQRPQIHKCIDCDKVFNKACYLTQHNKSFHSGAKPYKCERCGKRFPAESLQQEHISKHAGEKPYKCDVCPKQFNHKTDLRRHMCLHTGDKPYACDHCGKGFIRKDHMLKHCETHKKRKTNGDSTRFGGRQTTTEAAAKQRQRQNETKMIDRSLSVASVPTTVSTVILGAMPSGSRVTFASNAGMPPPQTLPPPPSRHHPQLTAQMVM